MTEPESSAAGGDQERSPAPAAPRPGLSTDSAASRLRTDGPNALPAPSRPNPLLVLGGQLVHFFAVMLWVAAGLALVAGLPALSVAIVVVILLNGAFSFIQEYRADRAAERLRDLLPVRATVRRDGHARVVPAEELVVGDLLLLQAGDRVCADATVEPGGRLSVDESLLTGESTPVTPRPGGSVYAGTHVVEGHGAAVVTATGTSTRLAGIAAVTERASRPRSPLARQLHRVVKTIAVAAVGVGATFFLVSFGLGTPGAESVLLAIGVTVALVPEGLLPTVTLSLARAAQRMAGRDALVRRLESVETLGATTFICTDKTGTLTRNEMSVVAVWTPMGKVTVAGQGYAPHGRLAGDPAATAAAATLADRAARCSPDARAAGGNGRWHAIGDPMEVALHVLAARAGREPARPPRLRFPFDPRRRRSSVVDSEGVHVVGAPDAVLPLCPEASPGAASAVAALTAEGLRVLAVAGGNADREVDSPEAAERDLELLGIVGLEDPPRPDVAEAITACRAAGIRLAMVSGDHPGTAAAIAREVGLLGEHGLVVEGENLPRDEAALGELLDADGVVIARVTPEDKLRIARALQARGHVVAMTGDGVNDGPALRAADIGVAMGASGTDVAREAADLVLLDDHFATIVSAVELGRATFANIRRFLTYHLTDNVAELTPFLVWALSGESVPLAIGVLQILALDIGTDLLPALALGAEPPNPRTMRGPLRAGGLIDRRVLGRAFGVLGPVEGATAMTAFVLVLFAGGWSFGTVPDSELFATASGTAFTAIVLGQLANAFACRSESRWVGKLGLTGNPLLLYAVGFEIAMLWVFLLVPPLPRLLGGTLPGPLGWALAALAIPGVWLADTVHKALRRR
ncbi:magnesium-transporting ATPase (P-type) [Saccharomonospora amisosensis]|uniref:Magnesium-transporting ATPase (P-type) n=1 Tax=Saccharomonospora amisosensis TaxID=1128677 RepID=A0A7X5ZR10_9PSEU|nr:cation-transporting P-type ATPase [Saccharomonospora amisosensis]NIJ12399.1 magnesium-transporting ATPase (P-type) [Saccharomonospora amisosensis]